LSEENEKDETKEVKMEEENFAEKSEIISNTKEESEMETSELTILELKELLSKEKQNLSSCEEKLKRSLADYQNLQRKTNSDIQNGVNAKIDQLMKNFLSIYDDLIRGKTALVDENVNVDGLESILKNMNSLLSENGITPINALGEIFDPNLHEAVSVIEDPSLDDGTITKEIRKGYISQNRIIRPSIVEISKKSNLDESSGD
jgi:molecular chaperone GrpE